jgi:formaldehyde-activating enzyme
MNALTQGSKWHIASLALLEPNLPSKPMSVLVNEMTLRTTDQVSLFLGPINAAVAHAVVEMVAEGTIPKETSEDLLILAQAFIHWEAKDKKTIYENNHEATRLAMVRAFRKEPSIDEILRRRDTAKHFFYQPQNEDP